MKFYSAYNRPPANAEPKCPKEVQDYILDIETNALVCSGTIPFYERIQSFHDSTRLSTKLKRFASGDSTALGAGIARDSDFSGAPTDLRQVLDLRQKINQDFTALPNDIRQLFGNNVASFEAAVKDGTAERRIFDHLTKQQPGGSEPGGSNPPAGE